MLYMFTRVFGNFHLMYEGYFVISNSIPLNLFVLAKMSVNWSSSILSN